MTATRQFTRTDLATAMTPSAPIELATRAPRARRDHDRDRNGHLASAPTCVQAWSEDVAPR